MADRRRHEDDDVVVVEHPNREKRASKATKGIVVALLLLTTALLVAISVGGWAKTAGAKPLQVFFIVLFVVFAVMVLRWSRGILPVIAAFAILLLIFAAVAAPGWYDRAKDGFAATTLEPDLLGLLCALLVPLQLLLIAFAMRGFRQAWNVEVERPPA
jgi:hypothetical protein